MTRYTKKDDGMYHISGKRFRELIGTRAQVWHGTAYKTAGDLKKSELMQNKEGRIVSKAKHNTAKKEMRLVKYGFGAEKGKFGMVRLDGTRKTARKGKKGKKGGAPYGNSLSPTDVSGLGLGGDSINVQLAAGMAGGRRSRRMRGGYVLSPAPVSAIGNSMSSNFNSQNGLTQYPNNSTDVQIAAGMAGGRRSRHRRTHRGGTTSRGQHPGSVGVQLRAGLGN